MRILHNPAVQMNSAPDTDSRFDTTTSSTGEPEPTGAGREFSRLFADIVCEQARQYMNSYPGNHALGGNASYLIRFEELARGEIRFEDGLRENSEILCYRLSMTKLATEMKTYLDLPIVDAHLFNVVSWERRLGEEIYKRVTKEKAPWTRYNNILSMIREAHIFASPVGNQGLFYSKPSEYLAIAFYGSGRSMAQISSDIEKLAIFTPSRVERPAKLASSSLGEFGSAPLGLARLGSFANIVAEQARQYLNSYPGNDASAFNPQHSWFRRIARGQITDREHLEILSDELCYRNALTGAATRYKDFLELPIEDAHLFDAWAWQHAWQQEQKPNKQWDRYLTIHHTIHNASVFGLPEPHQGYFFAKPTKYLAIAFVKSGRPMQQVLAEIKNFK
ncbi:hypothetical protein VE03_02403 [Pseudogymnoascus sp. 23342-1-I1]|nr:hypothetical protein VE03_02403 [Pseudogymnoascus sp. 23342-1-I1]